MRRAHAACGPLSEAHHELENVGVDRDAAVAERCSHGVQVARKLSGAVWLHVRLPRVWW